MLRIPFGRATIRPVRERVVHHTIANTSSLGSPGNTPPSTLPPSRRRHHSTEARTNRPQSPPEKEESFPDLLASLPGTVQPHRCLVLLNSPTPITEFPSRHTTKLQRELQLRLIRLGGLVNFAWFGTSPHATTSGGSTGEEEVLSGVAYTPNGGRLDLPHISHSAMNAVVDQLTGHMEATAIRPGTQDHIDILVCTHGARDCRCGETGGTVYDALDEEVTNIKRHTEGLPDIRIGQVAHVGGHKYAANVLIYPHGEWLGLIKPEDAPTILHTLLARVNPASSREDSVRPLNHTDPFIIPDRWRGRMGLGKDEQVEMFKQYRGQRAAGRV